MVIGLIVIGLIMVSRDSFLGGVGDPNIVAFRTGDLNYGRDNTIAFNMNCDGGDLEIRIAHTWSTSGSCETDNYPDLFNVPGSMGGIGNLIFQGPYAGQYEVCQNTASGKKLAIYNSGDYGTETSTSIDPAREVTCADIPYCGNGVLDAGEQCDDSNTVSGDGCSSTCKVEDTCSDFRIALGAEIPQWFDGSLSRDSLGSIINNWVMC